MDDLIAFDGVSLRSVDGREVFSDVSWRVRRGARVRIAAERGEGATALLRLCAGLAHPHAGRVLLDGVAHEPERFDHPFLRRGALGWAPQEGGLLSNLDLLENVVVPLLFVGDLSRAEAERRALAALESLGLRERAGRRPHELLRKERHLGALARAAAMEAELWLWDRPLDELDSAELDRVLAILRERLEAPSTTLLVVGDEAECGSFTSTVVRVAGGRLVTEEGA